MERVFIVEQNGGRSTATPGRILILNLADNSVNETPFLVQHGITTGGEQGLLGLAFHPNYATNGYFYVNYTIPAKTRVTRYQVSEDPEIADSGSAMPVLGFTQPNPNHNAGWMDFGADGYLYIASGDGGGKYDNTAGDDVGNAQAVFFNLLGKILRIDVDSDAFPGNPDINYDLPPDNPGIGRPFFSDEIWVYGLRNPWRPSFDRETGDLWIADVGQITREEINFQPADSPGGENYGWRLREGTIATPPQLNSQGEVIVDVGGPQPEDGVDPIFDYVHEDDRCSITGGYVYRGPVESLQGQYFFADHCTGEIWSLRHDGSDPVDFDGENITDLKLWSEDPDFAPDSGSITYVSSFGEDHAGNLYIVDLDGEIFRIEALPEPTALLSGLTGIAGLAFLRRRPALRSRGFSTGC
jgi:hypothetical protein